MAGGIRPMQGQLYGAEKLYFALLRLVSEAHSLSFALRKAKARGAVRRRQAGLMVKRYVAGCHLHQPRATGLLGWSGRGVLVGGAVQIDLHVPGAANALQLSQIVARARVQIVKAFTSAAVSSDPYVLEEAAAAFHEFGGARGTHGEFRTVAHYLREAKSRRALLHAGRHSRRHLPARLARLPVAYAVNTSYENDQQNSDTCRPACITRGFGSAHRVAPRDLRSSV